MYSMDNIEIENTLSIKQIFELFPCSYFESQGNTNNKKFTPRILIKISISMNWLLPKLYMENEESRNPPLLTLFFLSPPFLFFSKRKVPLCY